MGIRRCNGEGYHDLTTYEALSNIRKEEKAAKRAYRPLVYICSLWKEIRKKQGITAVLR